MSLVLQQFFSTVLDDRGSSRVHFSPFWAFFSSARSSSPALSVSCEQRGLRLAASHQDYKHLINTFCWETSLLSPLPPPHWNPSSLLSLPQIFPVLPSPSCAPPPPQTRPLWCSRSSSEWWRSVGSKHALAIIPACYQPKPSFSQVKKNAQHPVFHLIVN